MTNLDILYEDNHLLVMTKPAGMLVHNDATGDDTLLQKGKEYIKINYNKPGEVFLGLVHRLDRPVSGIIVLARTSKALSRLNELFRNREVTKKYWAIVEGPVKEPSGVLRQYLIKDHQKNKVRIYPHKVKNSKEAVLRYDRLAVYAGRSLLSIDLQTGRPHQIRAQLSYALYPIEGDLKYGAKHRMVDRSIALHCYSLSFNHPVKKDPVHFYSRMPSLGIWQEFKAFE